jgi:hypothetical protein
MIYWSSKVVDDLMSRRTKGGTNKSFEARGYRFIYTPIEFLFAGNRWHVFNNLVPNITTLCRIWAHAITLLRPSSVVCNCQQRR